MKKFENGILVISTWIGILTLILTIYMFFTQSESNILHHTTISGEQCYIISTKHMGVSLAVFKQDLKEATGKHQLYQIIIKDPSDIKWSGVAGDAVQCLKWAATDPELGKLPDQAREIFASRIAK